MRNSKYTALTLNIPDYNNPRPLPQLKQRLDEIYFGDRYQPHQWFLAANGRTAIYVFLKSLNLPPGSEVITQSFTCITAINPIVWAGLVPRYADIDSNTLSTSPESLQGLINKQTKVIMLQHTFGAPGALKDALDIAKKHNLIVLEDCAHALGSKTAGQTLGTFGDAAIISFGIEKTLSTKFGGALLVNNPELVQSVEATYSKLNALPLSQTFLWLIYPLIRKILRKLPPKLALLKRQVLETTGLLKRSVSKPEYTSKIPKHTLNTLPGVHAKIILDALKTLDTNLSHRQDISKLYQEWFKKSSLTIPQSTEPTPLIKFPLICESTQLRNYLLHTLTSKGIYATKWYDPAIYPAGVSHHTIAYNPTDCPTSESVANRILNLPTGPNINRHHATMIANEVNSATAQYARRA
jgi:dTDP-4-amino-4,6-dideoxygalactose transaminase